MASMIINRFVSLAHLKSFNFKNEKNYLEYVTFKISAVRT